MVRDCIGILAGECARCYCALAIGSICSHVGASSNVGKHAVEYICIRTSSDVGDHVRARSNADACVWASGKTGVYDTASNGDVKASSNVVSCVGARSSGGECVAASISGDDCISANSAIRDRAVTGSKVCACVGASSDVDGRGGASRNDVDCVRASGNAADCVWEPAALTSAISEQAARQVIV